MLGNATYAFNNLTNVSDDMNTTIVSVNAMTPEEAEAEATRIWVTQVRFAIEGVTQGIVGIAGLVGK